MLQSTGLQRVRHDLATEQQQQYSIVCVCTTTSLSIHLLMDSCFSTLAIVDNNTSMNIRAHVSKLVFWFFILPRYNPEVELLDHMVLPF